MFKIVFYHINGSFYYSAAVSFMVADMFDRSIDAGAITKAAR